SAADRTEVHARALERLRSLPAVAAASPTFSVPFRSSYAVGFEVEGLDSLPRLPSGGPYVNAVDAEYFETMGIELERGRVFPMVTLGAQAPYEVVINRTMADAYWPEGQALGQCVRIGGDDEPCTTVVGIVADHRREDLEEEATGLYYVPMGHPSLSTPPQSLMIRTAGPPAAVTSQLRDVLREVDGGLRFVRVQPLEELVSPHLRSWRLGAVMLSIFGVLALVVAAVGLYGVLAFEVARRRRELGVRAALGAAVGDLVGMVLRDAVLLTAAGIVVGGGLAALAARQVAPLLFHVSPWQPQAYAVMAITLLATAVVAGGLPAWRTTRVDPSEALRNE
ncbi:MAG: FtsX-like permease family protein, partial [Longimicrobiales bacterium]